MDVDYFSFDRSNRLIIGRNEERLSAEVVKPRRKISRRSKVAGIGRVTTQQTSRIINRGILVPWELFTVILERLPCTFSRQSWKPHARDRRHHNR